MARVKAQSEGGGAHSRDTGSGARQARPIRFLVPFSIFLGAGLALGLVATTGAQEDAARPRARTAFQAARECNNRRDYEKAALFLIQVQGNEGQLEAAEQRDLAELVRQNKTALQERRDGAARLLQAEEALTQGRVQEANALAKVLTVNQYLAEADKQRVSQLNERLRTAAAGTPGGNPATREDARTLTAAARAALARGDLDRAEQFAHQAEKVATGLPAWMQPWNDNPSRVLRDIQGARSKLAARDNVRPALTPDKQRPDAGTGNAPAVAAAQKPTDPINRETQYRPGQDATPRQENNTAAGQLVKNGYEALRQNDVAAAQRFAEQAQALHPNLQWWEDSPEKLMAEIRRRGTPAAQVAERPPARDVLPAVATTTAGQPPPREQADNTPSDPRALVRDARRLFKEGRLDEADRLSLLAAAVPNTRWGLFEDSPEKLRVDIQKGRARKDKDESAKLLVQAREAFKKGDYQAARTMAYQVKRLHGPYSIWEMGDRPDRLLTEVHNAELAGGRSSKVHDPVARNHSGAAGAPNPQDQGLASMVSVQAKQRAQALLAEAKGLSQQGLLVEARQKAIEAQRFAAEAARGGVFFERNEENPDQAVGHLGALCEARIQAMLRDAEGVVNAAPRDAAAYQWAMMSLGQARQLAVSFSLDTNAIDQKAAWAQVASGQAPAPPGLPAPGGVPAPVLPTPQVTQTGGPQAAAPLTSPRGEGMEILEKARLELKNGQLNLARKLAEQVFIGPYGLQAEARGFLNSLDLEEEAQRRNASNRKFDDAYEAFVQKDYNLARTILASVDEGMLTANRQSRLREVSGTPEMQPGRVMPSGGAVQTASVPGKASVTDLGPLAANRPAPDAPGAGPGDIGFADHIKAMEEVLFDKLRRDGLDEQKRAMASANAKVGDYDTAIDILRTYVERVAGATLPPERITLLRKSAENRMQEYRKLKAQKEWEEKQYAAGHEMGGKDREKKRVLDQQKRDTEIEGLMKQFNGLTREGKYDEAVILAYKMKEIDSDNVAADAAIQLGKIRREVHKNKEKSEQNDEFRLRAWDDAERLGPYVDGINTPLDFNKNITQKNQARLGYGKGIQFDNRNAKERYIEQKLVSQHVTLNVKDMPLKNVIEYLHDMSGVNVVADKSALDDAAINLEQPLTLKVEDMSLKSALNILLKQVRLTYVIRDEALQITTENEARGKLKMVTYPVADLVVPVENHSLPVVADFNEVAKRHTSPSFGNNYGGPVPFTPPNAMPGAAPVSAPGSGTGWAGNNSAAGAGPSKPPPGSTIEDLLIRMITNTVEPSSWTDMGGKGTIQYFPLGLALVINQTQDIQEQIQDLLAALRRLQDLEVAIEMRLVSVSEAFFERMGVDFDINITNNSARYEPQLVTQQFQPPGFINAFRPSNFFSGITPAGTFTPDLGVPLKNSSFDFSLPPFGGYPGTLGADGGLTLGLAFLSDIQVFMLLEAAQGDRRVNVMQAPKITVFNGQNAFIQVTDAQFFLTQINVVPFGSQLIFNPQNSPIFFGVTMNVTPVVSADRRFVRLNLQPQLSNLFSATVPLVPIQIPVNDLFNDTIVSAQPRIFQTFFQQPAVSQVTLNTTVVIPDGGTVLLGGLKSLSEGRNEFGPPVLSKIPYLSRLFKNVGYGRETQSLMILVTARIIINEEEEQVFLGTLPPIPR